MKGSENSSEKRNVNAFFYERDYKNNGKFKQRKMNEK